MTAPRCLRCGQAVVGADVHPSIVECYDATVAAHRREQGLRVTAERRLAEVEKERDALRVAWAEMGVICHEWRADWTYFDGRALLAQWQNLSDDIQRATCEGTGRRPQ